MNKFLQVLILACVYVSICQGLHCWSCENARTNDECLTNGYLETCKIFDAVCEDQVRHGEGGQVVSINKGCKQEQACTTNYAQNLKQAYPIQCNLRSPSSLCTCCCDTNLCNADLLACWKDQPQYANPGKNRCRSTPMAPENGNKQCFGNLEPNTFCDFECHRDHFLEGASRVTCMENFKWDFPPPICRLVTCPPYSRPPPNGYVKCSNGAKLGSECRFACKIDYKLIGESERFCFEQQPGIGKWSSPPPICKEMVCNHQPTIPNGKMFCTRGSRVDSKCTFKCDTDYLIQPSTFDFNTCDEKGKWSKPTPCCRRPCPPFIVMDFIVVLDSSSSVGAENWVKMKKFVRSFLSDFVVSNTSAHYSIVRYNRDVDVTTQILLDDFPSQKEELLEKFDEIPYDGSGTNTGRALNYTVDLLLNTGNRPQAKDVVLLITDGTSQDDVIIPAQRLRETGALLKVLPVKPPGNRKLNHEQIYEIAGKGNEDNVILDAIKFGFDALDKEFAKQITQLLCSNPCQR